MNCNEARPLTDAWLDGELELGRQLQVDQHLDECTSCARAFQARRAVQSAVRTGDLYFRAPADLERRVRRMLPRRSPIVAVSGWRGLAAAAAVVLLVSSAALWLRQTTASAGLTAQEVVSGHIRSLQPGHLLDVSSSDQHSVKPWFAGRVDFSPPVVDLPEKGFPLVGGRLDSIDGRTVAAVVYERRQHLINLFVWPSRDRISPQALQVRGFNLVHWSRAGLEGWVVSDLNAAELEEFSRLLLAQLPAE